MYSKLLMIFLCYYQNHVKRNTLKVKRIGFYYKFRQYYYGRLLK